MPSVHEAKLALQIRAYKLPPPVAQLKFYPTRKWQFDFAWPDLLLACEVDGGTWINGRHNRGQGIQDDCDKYEAAMLMGWDIYRCTAAMVKSGRAVQTLSELIQMKQAKYGD